MEPKKGNINALGKKKKRKEKERKLHPAIQLAIGDLRYRQYLNVPLALSGFCHVSRDVFSEEVVLGLGTERGEEFKEVERDGKDT